ncbi:MarR family transcriptional regulator [Streptomyces sp. SID8364]|nr:MarR family transcriptional regulator [Streptomyces sp. SID8364]
MSDSGGSGPPPADGTAHNLSHHLRCAHVALRDAQGKTLRKHGLTVPQYACLQALAACPGLSTAGLARATLVTRQSIHTVLRSLQDLGLLARPAIAGTGRARPALLTDEGTARLQAAQDALQAVESRVRMAVPDDNMNDLLDHLNRVVFALTD